jgi:hypothetical protein
LKGKRKTRDFLEREEDVGKKGCIKGGPSKKQIGGSSQDDKNGLGMAV